MKRIRLSVHPDYAKKIRTEAYLQGKTLVEYTKQQAKEVEQETKNIKKNARFQYDF